MIGIDIVHVPEFARQLATPGSTFDAVFTSAEKRVAAMKPDRNAHLAGRWAAKEAFIKACSQSIYGRPPFIGGDDVDFSEIEIRPDRWGRVQVVLHGRVKEKAGEPVTHLSISHDGDYAVAVCQFQF